MIDLIVDESEIELEAGESGIELDVSEQFVEGGGGTNLQSNKTVTPTTSQVQYLPDSGYDGLEKFTVEAIPSEYIVPTGTKNIAENGNNQDVKAYEKVNVNVPNSYSQSDEGKVVQSGALVAQTSDTVTQNGVVDTTLINSLDVNVSGGGSLPSRISSIITCTLAADYFLGEVAANAILSAAGFSTKQSNHAYLIQLIDKNTSDYGTDQFVGGVYYSSGSGALVRWRNSNYSGAIGSNSSAVYAYTGDNYMVIDMIMVES